MTKLVCGLVAVVLVALGVIAEAQQPTKIPRIGYLSGAARIRPILVRIEAFRRGVRDLGYIEGKNILVEYRYAEGKLDRIPSLVAELVQLKVDVLVSPAGSSDPCSQAGDQDDSHCHGDNW